MTKTIYPRDEDHVYAERCPNIRIGFVRSVYKEIVAEDAKRNEDTHFSSVYMADIATLLHKLPKSYRTLLFYHGAKIVLNKDHRCIANTSYKRRRIRINFEYIEHFTLHGKMVERAPRAAQLFYTTLFEETVHYLVSATRFYQTPGYLAAMRREIKSLSPLQRGIMRLERAYTASRNEGKRALSYIAPNNQPEELLVDLLRMKNYLAAQDFSLRDINSFMKAAFPHSWPYARMFEKQIRETAREITHQQHAPTHCHFRPNGIDYAQMPHLRRLVKQALQKVA